MDCMGCIYFYPKGEYLGYCEMMERAISVNGGCDEGISIDLECKCPNTNWDSGMVKLWLDAENE